jgi:hypothetical protein
MPWMKVIRESQSQPRTVLSRSFSLRERSFRPVQLVVFNLESLL